MTKLKDPFYYKQRPDSVRGSTFWVYIDEGNDTAQVIYHDIHDVVTARDLTNRLNNAIYRWMVKNGIQVPTDAQQG
jgi:hypothetical protein